MDCDNWWVKSLPLCIIKADLPASVTNVEEYAFFSCTSLKEAAIRNGVFGAGAFENTFGNTMPGSMGSDFETSSTDDLPF